MPSDTRKKERKADRKATRTLGRSEQGTVTRVKGRKVPIDPRPGTVNRESKVLAGERIGALLGCQAVVSVSGKGRRATFDLMVPQDFIAQAKGHAGEIKRIAREIMGVVNSGNFSSPGSRP